MGAATAQQAFDGTAVKRETLTLTATQRVYLGVEDAAMLDNVGGVSLRIALPEPGATSLLGAGMALLLGLARRRALRG